MRVVGADPEKGAFFPVQLLYDDRPFERTAPHDIEAFGPVNTVMPYDSVDEAVALANLGRGSLVGSLFTADAGGRATVRVGTARLSRPPHDRRPHEREGVNGPRLAAAASGARRAGPRGRRRGDGRGARRAALHAADRAPGIAGGAVGSVTQRVDPQGGRASETASIRSRSTSMSSEIGETLHTHGRTVTESDIVNFAGISGDFFYAHMDDVAAKDSIFERRVAHGYFVLSAAAGCSSTRRRGQCWRTTVSRACGS